MPASRRASTTRLAAVAESAPRSTGRTSPSNARGRDAGRVARAASSAGLEEPRLDRQLLRGLAFAHEAGLAHRDLQRHNLLVSERGQVCVMAPRSRPTAATRQRRPTRAQRRPPGAGRARGAARAARRRRARRARLRRPAARPAHGGRPPTAPTSRGLTRSRRSGANSCACPGRRRSRFPSRCARSPTAARRPGATALSQRAHLPRCAHRLARSAADDAAGPVALLLDRLHTVGHLPALPGLAGTRAARHRLESQRTDEIAATCCPTWRSRSSCCARSARPGPRARTSPATGRADLAPCRRADRGRRRPRGRQQPAHLARPARRRGARALRPTIDRVRLAGHVAQALRPAGYDGEAVNLVAALQSLGRPLVRYHFADEAKQIHQLTQPMPATRTRRGRRAGAARPGRGSRRLRRARRRGRGLRRRRPATGARRRGPAHHPPPARAASPVRKPMTTASAAHPRQRCHEIVDALDCRSQRCRRR